MTETVSEVEIERKKSVIEGFSEVISARRATEVPTGSARNGRTSSTSEPTTTRAP